MAEPTVPFATPGTFPSVPDVPTLRAQLRQQLEQGIAQAQHWLDVAEQIAKRPAPGYPSINMDVVHQRR